MSAAGTPGPLVRGAYQLVVDEVRLDVDPLMTLVEASELPVIAGLFSTRSLQRAAQAGELKASLRRGRLLTRAFWIDAWIEDGTTWHARPAPHGSISSPHATPGRSATSETTEEGSAWDAINRLRRRPNSPRT